MNIYLDQEGGPRKRRKTKKNHIFIHPPESGLTCNHGDHSI